MSNPSGLTTGSRGPDRAESTPPRPTHPEHIPSPASPTFRALRSPAEAHPQQAADGMQAHFDKLEVERQSMREWMTSAQATRNDYNARPPGLPHRRPTAEMTAAEKERQRRGAEERRREEGVVEALAGGWLPEELVLLILGHVVDRRLPRLEIPDDGMLALRSKLLLGDSPSARKLRPLVEQLILERSRITLDITFTRQKGGGDPIAQLPPFASRLPHPIAHLELACDVDIYAARLTYPIAIFRLTRGAASLRQVLPNLQTFTLLLNLNVDDGVGESFGAALGVPCFCGYTTTTTHREIILKMLSAIYSSGPGRRKLVRLAIVKTNYEKRYEGPEIAMRPSVQPPKTDEDDDEPPIHPMAHVLDKALDVKLVSPRRSRAPPQMDSDPPALELPLRDNDDMLMLEDETQTVGFAGGAEMRDV